MKEPFTANRAGQTAKDIAKEHGHAAIVRLLDAPQPRAAGGGGNFGTRSDDDVRDDKKLQ